MKKFILLIMCVISLSACKSEYKDVNMGRTNEMNWEDAYFEQIFSQVFDKPGDRITYGEVNSVEKISRLYVEENGIYNMKISVELSNFDKPKFVKEPEKSMENISDLIHFKNLQYFETPNVTFNGAEVLKDMPQLKSLRFDGNDISENMLEQVATYSNIEKLTIPCTDIDYSCLTQMRNLKIIELTSPSSGKAIDFEPLISLPNEKCLLDLSLIEHEKLTPVLYTLFSTHPNISKIGKIYVEDNQDISFFENMKDLNAVDIVGSPDFMAISRMTWLKELTIWGNIDISQLLKLSNLEKLELNRGFPDEGELPPVFSFYKLGEYKNLQKLELNGYVLESLNGVEAYPQLKILICRTCMIEDINALASLHQLEYLDLTNNLITDISAMKSLDKLKYVSFDQNGISDISSLKNCINMEFLCLDGNFVADISPLSNLLKLEELQIQINDSDTAKNIDLNSWRNTLLSLPNLQYYAGGLMDSEWISKNLPSVIHGRSNME